MVLNSSNYYWPKLTSHVAHYMEQYFVCQQPKRFLINVAIYTLLHVHGTSWIDVSMNLGVWLILYPMGHEFYFGGD